MPGKITKSAQESACDLNTHSFKTTLRTNCFCCVIRTKQTASWCNWPSIIWVINVNSHINDHLPLSSDDHLRGMSRARVRQRDGGGVILWQVEVFVRDVTFLSWIPIAKDTGYLYANRSLTCSLFWYCNCLYGLLPPKKKMNHLTDEIWGDAFTQRLSGLDSVFFFWLSTWQRRNERTH